MYYTYVIINHSMNPDQERLWVLRAQNKDKEALGLLWDALTPKLFGYLVNVIRDKTVAEDILQTTWLKAIQALPDFQLKNTRISAWLFAIARNECRQHWRKSKQELAFDPQEHDSPSNDHQESENKVMIEQMLSRLSEDDRELIRLRYIADLPLSDIAKILNLNSVTVRVRLHRALARARSILIQNL